MSPQPSASVEKAPAWSGAPVSKPQLYSRDGTPVESQEPGTVAVSDNTGQVSTQQVGSRWKLLEQYQQAVTEKEDLEFEVKALGAALDQVEENSARMVRENDELRSQMALYEKRIAALENESIELAARLTTAQVRRLQSEKLLLEAKLDWKRVQAVINQPEDPMAPTEASARTPQAEVGH